jgi:hypothetical protein
MSQMWEIQVSVMQVPTPLSEAEVYIECHIMNFD